MEPPVDPTHDPSGATLSERAASVLQHAILSGELLPGAKLRVAELAQTYGIGATPLREGLSRLLAFGLVQSVGQRGFRVARTSLEDLEDILLARTLIETEALRLAIAKGDDDWEADIVAALHRLRKSRAGDGAGEGAASFDAIHKAFHTALLAACGSPRLLGLHSMLYDQTYRYRRVVLSGNGFRPAIVDDEHSTLADIVLARDAKAACGKLRAHLALTLKLTLGNEGQR